MNNHRLSRLSTAVVFALGLSTAAMANETSSSIAGKIETPTGAPAANTKVIITHIPTGTVSTVETNASGAYTLRGLRVGGPYKIVIDSAQYKDQQFSNIFLEVGKPYRLSAHLEPDNVEKIVVTGSKIVGFTNAGSAGTWGAEDIINSAGGNRDLKDILRSNPLVNVSTDSDMSMSIAGSNPRYNSFTVDGVQQNDDFGLNGNGYPTQRSPISIDAVEQVSVDATPFSVKNGGFSGGQINAVTKSGTNEFHGTLSYQKTSSAWAGTPTKPDGTKVKIDYKSTDYSATLGGPIIKDKLFFFGSYDSFDKPTALDWGPSGTSAPNASNVSQADYQQVLDIAKNVYGIDAGIWNKQPKQTDKKILLKLDWNINDDQRAAFTYQDTDGNVTRGMSTSARTLNLSTHWYNKHEVLQSYAANFYSNWSDKFSSELKVAYKKVKTGQNPETKAYGAVSVRTAGGTLAFGPDKYRHGNALSNNTLSLRFVGDYLYKEHEITFGGEYKSIDVVNLFAPNSLGSWQFNSIADFQNKQASRLDYANAYTNNVADAEAKFTFANLALFAEDAFYVNDDLLITAGVRFERISSSDRPTNNPNFEARYGFSNSVNLNGNTILLPRISFNWDYNENLTIHGGVGRFSGGRPNVWLSNSYSNDGVTYVTARNTNQFLANADVSQVPQGVLDAMTAGDGNVNVTDPNFKIPSDWRFTLASDYTFAVPNMGDNWVWSAQYLYIKKENDVFWRDLTRQVAGQTAAGQNIYQPIDKLTGNPTNRYDLMLTNAANNGRSKIFTTSLSSYFNNGLGFNMAYTHEDITEGTPGTSSTATSNFQYPVTTDRNYANVGVGGYEIEHSFKLNVNYKVEFIENYPTKFNLFFERHSGRPFSWVLGSYHTNDLGDQSSFYNSNAYLPYVPTGATDPNVVYSNGLTWDQMSGYLQQAGLNKFAGGFAQKNSGRAPWVTRMDLTITQEIPGFTADQKGEVFFNIRNLLNLIDNSKGQALRNQYGTATLVDYHIDAQGRYIYSTPYGGFNGSNWDQFDAEQSAWSVKMGVRYKF